MDDMPVFFLQFHMSYLKTVWGQGYCQAIITKVLGPFNHVAISVLSSSLFQYFFVESICQLSFITRISAYLIGHCNALGHGHTEV